MESNLYSDSSDEENIRGSLNNEKSSSSGDEIPFSKVYVNTYSHLNSGILNRKSIELEKNKLFKKKEERNKKTSKEGNKVRFIKEYSSKDNHFNNTNKNKKKNNEINNNNNNKFIIKKEKDNNEYSKNKNQKHYEKEEEEDDDDDNDDVIFIGENKKKKNKKNMYNSISIKRSSPGSFVDLTSIKKTLNPQNNIKRNTSRLPDYYQTEIQYSSDDEIQFSTDEESEEEKVIPFPRLKRLKKMNNKNIKEEEKEEEEMDIEEINIISEEKDNEEWNNYDERVKDRKRNKTKEKRNNKF